MSTIRRRDGSGGKMYVPRDRYSLTMSFCVVPRSVARSAALLLGVGDVQRQQPRRRGVDRHRRVHLAGRDAVEQRAHVAEVGDRARRPCRPRRGPSASRGRSRSGSAGRRRSTARSGPWPGSCGTARSRPAAVECPEYVRIIHGGSRLAARWCHASSRVRSLDVCSPAGAGAADARSRAVRRRRVEVLVAAGRRPRRATRGAASSTARRAALAPVSRSQSTSATSATFDASVACGTSTRRRTGRRCARRTARPPARRRSSRPRTSAPIRARAARVGVDELRRDPAAGRRGSAQRSITSGNRVSCADLVPAQLRRSERLTRSPSSGMIAARVGREPGDPAPAERHREQPGAVRGEQRARLEVGADADDVVASSAALVAAGSAPPRRRRLDRGACDGRHRLASASGIAPASGGDARAESAQYRRSRARSCGRGGRRRPSGAASGRRRSSGRGTRRTARRGSTATCRGRRGRAAPTGPSGSCSRPASRCRCPRVDAVPCSSIRTALLRYGNSSALTTNPARSATSMASLPQAVANAMAVLIVSSLAVSGRTTSTSLIIGAGLKKWMPHTRSGRVAWPSPSRRPAASTCWWRGCPRA